MLSLGNEGVVLVTGACGHIGHVVCSLLRASAVEVLPVDVRIDAPGEFVACDLTVKDQVARLFQSYPIRAVIHLAAILPSAFRSDPLRGAEVNLPFLHDVGGRPRHRPSRILTMLISSARQLLLS
jgi:nucleoside-diphosphate-sugar epimerase